MLRKATLKDITYIYDLILPFAEQNLMLLRSLNEICEHIRDFAVYIKSDEILGCCSLQIYTGGLAEIKSLAVKKEHQGKGIGSELVKYNTEEASKLEVSKVFALTYSQEFFSKLGFMVIDKDKLPQKIWRECIKCSKLTDCDEIAMIKEISQS